MDDEISETPARRFQRTKGVTAIQMSLEEWQNQQLERQVLQNSISIRKEVIRGYPRKNDRQNVYRGCPID